MNNFIVIAGLMTTPQVEMRGPWLAPPEIKVMIIDTGIARHKMLDKYVQFDFSEDYVDTHSHGTHVAGIVAYGNHNMDDPLCKEVKIFSCKYYGLKDKNEQDASVDCVKRAKAEGIHYINYSGGGQGWRLDEYEAYQEFSHSGGISVVAAGNNGLNGQEGIELTDSFQYFPASYSLGAKIHTDKGWVRYEPVQNMYVVQNETDQGRLMNSSNTSSFALRARGEGITSTSNDGTGFLMMTGTSQATPQILHQLLKRKCDDLKNNVKEEKWIPKKDK